MKLFLTYNQFLFQQPVWWQNFIRDVDKQINRENRNGILKRSEFISDALKTYSAVRVFDEGNEEEYIEFKDMEKATWFILKYFGV